VVAFMTQIWDFPVRSLWNAILEPSGDQVGDPSTAGSVVRRVSTPPRLRYTVIPSEKT